MASEFLTELKVHLLYPETPYNRAKWELLEDFIYRSEKHGIIIVPKGFITDFASVPRVPIFYMLTGSMAHRGAVVHDYLYKTHSIYGRPTSRIVDKKTADEILLEASLQDLNRPLDKGAGFWKQVRNTVSNGSTMLRAYIMYLGVRLFGQSSWK